ncbi:MAG TPA: hypothetical protein PKD73_00435 [Burkholderiaceae bacterium]|nr:hypothetical protein [Burkholderiaceae bacterium]
MTEPWIEVLLEGASDEPVLRHVLGRHFGLEEERHFRLHAHQGKGVLDPNPVARPQPHRRGLLHQLPAKLRGFGKSLPEHALVLVVIDVDDEDCRDLLRRLLVLWQAIEPRPRVLFRLAIEETESWFLAEPAAVSRAFPKADTRAIQRVRVDDVVGAWERLAEALNINVRHVTGRDKYRWAEAIAPHLTLNPPLSPSLGKLTAGVRRYLDDFSA